MRITREKAIEIRRKIERAAENQSDGDALESIELYPAWTAGISVSVGKRYRYKSKLYKVVQAHTTQEDWTPDVVPALFTEVSVENWPEWVQPAGAHDAYRTGDKVSYDGKHWECISDYNTYEPGVYGWKVI